jgi:hypothetical protein
VVPVGPVDQAVQWFHRLRLRRDQRRQRVAKNNDWTRSHRSGSVERV